MTASFASNTFAPDKLIAGNSNLLVARQITLITGQNLVRGTVLGKLTASGKYNQSLSAAVDGSQTPDLILAEDTDATAADKVTVAYSRGDFNQGAITLGTGHTVASVLEGLRLKGIVLLPAQS
jgi:hypothetical protein